ncbi:MAG: OprD family outer membrane porin [Helicobacteraceae bacterium]|nr:OprD family outer membrane porin [Helicobacteraceae bacterium]
MKILFQPLSTIVLSLGLIATAVVANEKLPKHTLKANSQIVYNETPKQVDSFGKIFSEGMYYGRIRSNTFYLDYKTNDSTHSDHLTSGLGASFIVKSAKYADFDFTTGLYASQATFWDRNDNVADLKKGKDVMSRFDYANHGDKYMAVLGQAYLQYSGINSTKISIGRQLVETFYTKSNDTKMFPNTFDAFVLETKALANTKIQAAYLYEQKLRDHTKPHAILMYGDANSTSKAKPQWSENDDSAMHKGLTYTALKAAGKPTDAPLLVMDIKNSSIENLKLDASFYNVPELLSQAMLEANYEIAMNGFSLSPGIRYIRQFDNGAGSVGGASLTGNTHGYKKADSLDSQMIAAKIVTKIDNYKINLAYSHIFDEADLVTPWRGFPTAGYTRSMARYNWRANTKSYRLEVVRNDNANGIYKDIFTQASILFTNADENKKAKDEIYYYVGLIQNIPTMIDLQWRLRLGYVQYTDADESDNNELDARFELNYLF